MIRKLLFILALMAAFCTSIANAEFTLDFYTFNAAHNTYYDALLVDEGIAHPPGLSYSPDFAPPGANALFSSSMVCGTVYLDPRGSLSVEGVFAIVYDQTWSQDIQFIAVSNLTALALALEYAPDVPPDESLAIGERAINGFYDFLSDVDADHGTCYIGRYLYELFDLKDGRIALLAWRNDGKTENESALYTLVTGYISKHRFDVAVKRQESDPYQVVTNSLVIRQSIAKTMGMESWVDTYKYDALTAAADKVREDLDAILQHVPLTDQDITAAHELLDLSETLRNEANKLTSW